MRRKIFRQCRSTALQKNYSLLAIRYSLPFRLGRSLALPSLLVPCPLSHVPFQVGAQVLPDYGLKSIAWFAFGCVVNCGLKTIAWFISQDRQTQ
jgi:hypothetical protein